MDKIPLKRLYNKVVFQVKLVRNIKSKKTAKISLQKNNRWKDINRQNYLKKYKVLQNKTEN